MSLDDKLASLGKKLPDDGLILIKGSNITPLPINWLWDGWLAAGKVHILGGAPGTGKTTIALALAATLTIGGRWPDGTRAAIGNVAIWSGEDDPADTLIPRLALAGADLNRVYFVGEITENFERRAFDPANDIELLRLKLAEIGDVKLLIIDPIVSAITGDSHKNAEVRRGLQPLGDLAANLKCALLGITHFTKGTAGRDPVERITGSLAFGAVARLVMVAAKQKDDDDSGEVRIFCRAKSNIGRDDGGFEYDLIQSQLTNYSGVDASSVLWGKALEGDARKLLAQAEADSQGAPNSALSEAEKFLAELLADGEKPTNEIEGNAKEAGMSWSTVKRAKTSLGLVVKKTGYGGEGKWSWKLPDTPTESSKETKETKDAQQNLLGNLSKFEHLNTINDQDDEGEI